MVGHKSIDRGRRKQRLVRTVSVRSRPALPPNLDAKLRAALTLHRKSTSTGPLGFRPYLDFQEENPATSGRGEK